jgi:FMN phosphatase YigB (HAD superfamily)
LFVGDDLDQDMHGAKALRMHTAWISPGAGAPDPRVDIHLRSLEELPARCEALFA